MDYFSEIIKIDSAMLCCTRKKWEISAELRGKGAGSMPR